MKGIVVLTGESKSLVGEVALLYDLEREKKNRVNGYPHPYSGAIIVNRERLNFCSFQDSRVHGTLVDVQFPIFIVFLCSSQGENFTPYPFGNMKWH